MSDAYRNSLNAFIAQTKRMLRSKHMAVSDKLMSTDLAHEPNSVTKMKELVPVRLATQRVLGNDEQWSGFELTEFRVHTSLFGGPHYVINLGSKQQAPAPTDKFVPMFSVRWSCTQQEMRDPAFAAQVRATAQALMDMINMRRKA